MLFDDDDKLKLETHLRFLFPIPSILYHQGLLPVLGSLNILFMGCLIPQLSGDIFRRVRGVKITKGRVLFLCCIWK